MFDSQSMRRLVAFLRWGAAPVHLRGFKVIGLGLAIFIVAGLLLYMSAGLIDIPYLGAFVRVIGGTAGFIGWGMVLIGMIGELRSYKRRVRP